MMPALLLQGGEGAGGAGGVPLHRGRPVQALRRHLHAGPEEVPAHSQ